jgi:hypothetical protein
MSTVTISLKWPKSILMQVGDREFKLNGWNAKEQIIITLGNQERAGITEDVPADLWNAWREKFKDHPLLVNGLVFAESSTNKAKEATKERKGIKSGVEALDPNANFGGVSKSDE